MTQRSAKKIFFTNISDDRLISILQASIWMIDFEKTHEMTPGINSQRDDGYLTGLESATDLLSHLLLPNPPSE